MSSEILEVSDVCPNTNNTIRVILLKQDEHFEIITEAKELVGEVYEFVETGRHKVSDEKAARARFQFTVDQLASLDSLE